MKEYPKIDDMLIEGEERLILPEVEREIMEYMEEWEAMRRRNATQAMIDARNIILGKNDKIY